MASPPLPLPPLLVVNHGRSPEQRLACQCFRGPLRHHLLLPLLGSGRPAAMTNRPVALIRWPLWTGHGRRQSTQTPESVWVGALRLPSAPLQSERGSLPKVFDGSLITSSA